MKRFHNANANHIVALNIFNKLRAEFRAEQQAQVSKFVRELSSASDQFEHRLDRVLNQAFRSSNKH